MNQSKRLNVEKLEGKKEGKEIKEGVQNYLTRSP